MGISFVWNYKGHNDGVFCRGPNWLQITVPGSREKRRCAIKVWWPLDANVQTSWRELRQAILRWQWRCRKALAQWLVDLIYGNDLLWPEDSEDSTFSLEEWAQDYLDDMRDGETATVFVSRAFRQKPRHYEITARLDKAEDVYRYDVKRVAAPKKAA